MTPSSGRLVIRGHKHVFRLWLARSATRASDCKNAWVFVFFSPQTRFREVQRPLAPPRLGWMRQSFWMGAPAVAVQTPPPLPLPSPAARSRRMARQVFGAVNVCWFFSPFLKSTSRLAWIGREWGEEARWLAAAPAHFPFPVWVCAHAGGVTERAVVITVCFSGTQQHRERTHTHLKTKSPEQLLFAFVAHCAPRVSKSRSWTQIRNEKKKCLK